jgi:hypothetical protein
MAVARVMRDVEAVKSVMSANVHLALERSEQLDDLQVRSADLSDASAQFKRSARKKSSVASAVSGFVASTMSLFSGGGGAKSAAPPPASRAREEVDESFGDVHDADDDSDAGVGAEAFDAFDYASVHASAPVAAPVAAPPPMPTSVAAAAPRGPPPPPAAPPSAGSGAAGAARVTSGPAQQRIVMQQTASGAWSVSADLLSVLGWLKSETEFLATVHALLSTSLQGMCACCMTVCRCSYTCVTCA